MLAVLYRYHKDRQKAEISIEADLTFIEELSLFEKISDALRSVHDQQSRSNSDSSMNSGAFELWFRDEIHDANTHAAEEIDVAMALSSSISEAKEDSSSDSSESFDPSGDSQTSDEQQQAQSFIYERYQHDDSDWILSPCQSDISSEKSTSHYSFQFFDDVSV
jgi:hypothetical protein